MCRFSECCECRPALRGGGMQLAAVLAFACRMAEHSGRERPHRLRNVLDDLVRGLGTALPVERGGERDRRLDLAVVLAVICKKTVEAFGCQRATVFFHSRRHRASMPLADHGTPPHVAGRFVGSRYNPGNIPHEEAVSEGRTVVISRGLDPSPEDIALLDHSETHALAL